MVLALGEKSNRFEVVSEKEDENSGNNDHWALNSFKVWTNERNKLFEKVRCEDLLDRDDTELSNIVCVCSLDHAVPHQVAKHSTVQLNPHRGGTYPCPGGTFYPIPLPWRYPAC